MKIIAEIFLDSFGFGWRLDDNQILHTYIIVNRFAKNTKLVLAENNKPKKIARQMGLAPSLRALAGYFLTGLKKPFSAEEGHSSAAVSVFTSLSSSTP